MTFIEQLTALLRAHTPSLSDEDDRKIDELRYNSDHDRYGQPAVDNSDLALRTCSCSFPIDGFYDYIDHLKEVASGTPITGPS